MWLQQTQLFCSVGANSRISLGLLTDVYKEKPFSSIVRQPNCLLDQKNLRSLSEAVVQPWTPKVTHNNEAFFSFITVTGLNLKWLCYSSFKPTYYWEWRWCGCCGHRKKSENKGYVCKQGFIVIHHKNVFLTVQVSQGRLFCGSNNDFTFFEILKDLFRGTRKSSTFDDMVLLLFQTDFTQWSIDWALSLCFVLFVLIDFCLFHSQSYPKALELCTLNSCCWMNMSCTLYIYIIIFL